MADRELLELAAKAHGNIRQPDGCDELMDDDTGRWWNPLTDDGDALRLAVKLKLGLQLLNYECIVYLPGGGVAERTTMGHGIEKATRRAIVRAAAEIGKAMP